MAPAGAARLKGRDGVGLGDRRSKRSDIGVDVVDGVRVRGGSRNRSCRIEGCRGDRRREVTQGRGWRRGVRCSIRQSSQTWRTHATSRGVIARSERVKSSGGANMAKLGAEEHAEDELEDAGGGGSEAGGDAGRNGVEAPDVGDEDS